MGQRELVSRTAATALQNLLARGQRNNASRVTLTAEEFDALRLAIDLLDARAIDAKGSDE
jgi:hypothetical protein